MQKELIVNYIDLVSIRSLLEIAMAKNDEDILDIVGMSFEEGSNLDSLVYSMDQTDPMIAFTIWTDHYVYFPVCASGIKWVQSVPRDPCFMNTLVETPH